MSPTTFARTVGRPVPDWLNLDVLIEPEEVAEIEQVRKELRALILEVIPVAERLRWCLALVERFRCDIDDAHRVFTEALDLDEIQNLGLLIGLLLDAQAEDPERVAHLTAGYIGTMPEVVAALDRQARELPMVAPEHGSFEIPRGEA